MGEEVAREVDKAYGLVDWPEQMQRVTEIVNRLAKRQR